MTDFDYTKGERLWLNAIIIVVCVLAVLFCSPFLYGLWRFWRASRP